MKYATLGNTGLIVSRVALGAMTFGAGSFYGFQYKVSQEGANELVARAIDAGVNLFDTANMYGNGQSEEILGRALGPRRKDAVLATKVAARMSDTLIDSGLSYRHVIASAEASLKRLGTDYIDLFQIHFADPLTPFEETARALDDLVRRGLVRYVGYSNLPAWQAALDLGLQRQHNYARFVSAQVYYSLLNRDIEHEIVPFAQQAGIGIMVYSPLAGGFLSGKYTRQNPDGHGGRLSSFSFLPIDREQGYTVVARLQTIAAAHDATPAQVALAWMLTKPYVRSIITGVNTLDQLDENLVGAKLNLSADAVAALDELTAPAQLYPNWLNARPMDGLAQQALAGEAA